MVAVFAFSTRMASAIVMIDHFDAPVGGHADTSGIIGGSGVGSLPYDAGIGHLGSGTIGNSRRIFASDSDSLGATTVQANPGSALSRLRMTLPADLPGAVATLVLDGTTSTADVGTFTRTSNTLGPNISYGLGADLTQGANGIWLAGITGGFNAGTTLRLGIFSTAASYAYFEIAGSALSSNLFIPFTSQYGFTEAVGQTFQTSSASLLTLTEIFAAANAIVLQVSNDSGSGGGGSFTVDAIYAHTPEPMSLVSWASLGLLGIVLGRRRKAYDGAVGASAVLAAT